MPDSKTCSKCRLEQPATEFHRKADAKDGLHPACKTCSKQRMREWYEANKLKANLTSQRYYENNKEKVRSYLREYEARNRDRLNAAHRARHARRPALVKRRDQQRGKRIVAELKFQVAQALGGKCFCCGIEDVRFLTIDHVKNDGMADRKSCGFWMNNRTFLQHVLAQGCPSDRYQLACCNCNMGRAKAGKGGECPHSPAFEASLLAQEKPRTPARTRMYLYEKQWRERLRSQVYEILGDKCYCCGESNHHFLTVDHIFDDGYVDRKRNGLKMNGGSFYKHMLGQEDVPSRYRLACYNCNMGRAFNKFAHCPHSIAHPAG